jgi:hypothetical protein
MADSSAAEDVSYEVGVPCLSSWPRPHSRGELPDGADRDGMLEKAAVFLACMRSAIPPTRKTEISPAAIKTLQHFAGGDKREEFLSL